MPPSPADPARHTAIKRLRRKAWCVTALALAPAVLLADPAAIRLAAELPPGWRWWAEALSEAGRSHWALVPSGVAALLLAALWRWWDRLNQASAKAEPAARSTRRRRRVGWLAGACGFLFAAVALSGLAVNVIKTLIGRPRPELIDTLGPYALSPPGLDNSLRGFPSGHATTWLALAAVVGVMHRPWFAPAACLALAIALFSRVGAMAHYPSDVLAGGAFSLLFCLWLARRVAAGGRLLEPLPPSAGLLDPGVRPTATGRALLRGAIIRPGRRAWRRLRRLIAPTRPTP